MKRSTWTSLLWSELERNNRRRKEGSITTVVLLVCRFQWFARTLDPHRPWHAADPVIGDQTARLPVAISAQARERRNGTGSGMSPLGVNQSALKVWNFVSFTTARPRLLRLWSISPRLLPRRLSATWWRTRSASIKSGEEEWCDNLALLTSLQDVRVSAGAFRLTPWPQSPTRRLLLVLRWAHRHSWPRSRGCLDPLQLPTSTSRMTSQACRPTSCRRCDSVFWQW